MLVTQKDDWRIQEPMWRIPCPSRPLIMATDHIILMYYKILSTNNKSNVARLVKRISEPPTIYTLCVPTLLQKLKLENFDLQDILAGILLSISCHKN